MMRSITELARIKGVTRQSMAEQVHRLEAVGALVIHRAGRFTLIDEAGLDLSPSSRRPPAPEPNPMPGHCVTCGTGLTGGQTRNCSNACAVKAKWARHPEKYEAWLANETAVRAASRAAFREMTGNRYTTDPARRAAERASMSEAERKRAQKRRAMARRVAIVKVFRNLQATEEGITT